MISVVTCTNREEYVGNILANFRKQTLPDLELILILNSTNIDFNRVKHLLGEARIKSRLLQFPEEMSLGECLNYGVERAGFDYVAKMDDDDYYGVNYLMEAYKVLKQTNAEIVGKSSFYIYIKENQELRLYNPHHENRWIINTGQNRYQTSFFLSGASMVFKKDLFNKVSFPPINQGEDSVFQQRCFDNKVKMYSLSKDHYIYVRYGNTHRHTSDATELALRRRSQFVLKTSSVEAIFSLLNKRFC